MRFCLKTGLLSNRGGAATVVDTLSPLVASRVSFEHICTQNTPFNTYKTTGTFDKSALHLQMQATCRDRQLWKCGGTGTARQWGRLFCESVGRVAEKAP